jgi:hypothetical protein
MSLETRYRRLLAWYPREHRAAHEEEMLAVLLAGAAPGQQRPAPGEALDVLRGGLAIRLRHARDRHWREAFVLAALLAPFALMTVQAGMAARLPWGVWQWEPGHAIRELAFSLFHGVVGVLVWLRRPGLAALAAWAWTALHAWLIITAVHMPVHVTAEGAIVLGGGVRWLAPAAAVALLLTLAPRGHRPDRAGRLVAGTVAVLALTVVLLPSQGLLALVPPAVAALVAARRPVGRRAVLVLAPPLVLTLGGSRVLWGIPDPAILAACVAVPLAAMAWLAHTARLRTARTPAG